MAVIVISASWAQKRLIPTFYTWCTFSSWKIFFSPIRASYLAVRLILAFLNPKTFDSYFLDMMYVEFMKNFLLADSSELLAVRLILASWAQKRLIPTFYTWCTFNSWKIFFSPIRASYWLLDSFWPPEPKNVWFLLSRPWCTSSSWKIFLPPIRATYWLLDSFWPPEPKNVWFLLSRHDVRWVHEKFSSRRFERADGS